MPKQNHVRPIVAVLIALALGLLSAPMASAQPSQDGSTKHSYPNWGKTLSASQILQDIAGSAGKNMVDPTKPQFPTEGMSKAKPDNSKATDPTAFGTSKSEAWFGKPGAAKLANGCTVAQSVLARDMFDVQLGPDGCTVTSGTFVAWSYQDPQPMPYNGTNVVVVPLVGPQYAYGRGAWAMGPDERLAMMNDPLNLIAVPETDENQYSKGLIQTPVDNGYDPYAATWSGNGYFPASMGKQAYIMRYLAVMMKYGITIEPDMKTGSLSSVQVLNNVMTGWTDTIDTSAAGIEKLSSTRFAETVSDFKLPSSMPKATATTKPSGSASPTEATRTSSPSSSAGSTTSGGSPFLVIILVVALAATAAIGFIAYRSRDKARQ